MAEIVLSTSNARYGHASLALRYLMANLGDLRQRAVMREFVIQDRPVDIAEELLAEQPRVVGLGVYIWNAAQALEVARVLKKVRPDIALVLGGPEVSHEREEQEVVALADFVVCGEGDLAFGDLCSQILDERPPSSRIICAEAPDLGRLASPYSLYSEADLRNRSVYVEASRGCPFGCEFCLSSLDRTVRRFPLEAFLADLDHLIARGAHHVKFVDRTFNLDSNWAEQILRFVCERSRPELFVHFEAVADRLPSKVREVLCEFAPGSVQLEVGVQSFDPATLERIGRRQDLNAVRENLEFLRTRTGVHVHADLIAGLPGETPESLAAGFDQLVALGPQEIQVGILKRLRGAPIARHEAGWEMVFNASPPYELLQSAMLPFETLQRIKRFARAWDLVANSGNFRDSAPMLWGDESPFAGFLAFSDWLFERVGPLTGIALSRLAERLLEYLVEVRGIEQRKAAETLAADYCRPGRGLPGFLAEIVPEPPGSRKRPPPGAPRRQARHLM